MATSFLSATGTSFLPVRRLSRHKPTTAPSFSFPSKSRRSPSCSLLPPELRHFSASRSFSAKIPASSLLSSITAASRTLLFLLVASLLALSGVRRPLPSLAAPPPPTQETKGQEEEPSEEEQEEEEEDEAKWFEKEEEEVEAAWMQPSDDEEEEEEDDEVQMYLEVLIEDPGDVAALKCVLFARMRRKDWGGALQYAAQLRQAEPGEVEWRLMEALLHELKGDLAEAERLFQDVLAEKPLLVRALHVSTLHTRFPSRQQFVLVGMMIKLAILVEY
jgi:hypothetical protein